MEGTDEEIFERNLQFNQPQVVPEQQESRQQQVPPQVPLAEQEAPEQEAVNDYYPDEVDEFEEGYDYDDFGEEESIEGSQLKPLGGIYQLFDIIHRKKDSTKVSNLNKAELGELGISVRESMRIAVLANTFHHPIFANFFLQQAGIISDSAMSKDGWFTELIVTSKKYASRESSSEVKNIPEFKKGKWKMFSGTSSGTSSGKNKNQNE